MPQRDNLEERSSVKRRRRREVAVICFRCKIRDSPRVHGGTWLRVATGRVRGLKRTLQRETMTCVLGAAISRGLDAFNVALAPAVRLILNFAGGARNNRLHVNVRHFRSSGRRSVSRRTQNALAEFLISSRL